MTTTYQLTINQRIINDSADVWVETFDTYAKAENRMAEIVKKMKNNYDPNYSIVVLNGIEVVKKAA